MTIFFDTNILFAAFGYRGLCRDLFRECRLHHTVVISTYVIDELFRNMKSKLDATEIELEEIRAQLTGNCVVFDSYKNLDYRLRDVTDIPILSAAVESGAEILVSGDKDLLDFDNPPIRILKPRELYDLIVAKA